MATAAQKEAFINSISPSVISNCKSHGWGVPSAIISQACLESNFGLSGLSKTCFNYFGMKWKEGCGCGYKEYKTGEQKTNGTYYTITAKFRKYNNVADGIDGYFKFIESYSRYKPVIAAKNYTEYATQLKACGWATSLKYTQNIIKTLEANSLQKYDTVGTYKIADYPLHMGDINDNVKLLQKNLNDLAGQGLTCDGSYGPKTFNAVHNVQAFCGMTADGIYNKDTFFVLSVIANQKGFI